MARLATDKRALAGSPWILLGLLVGLALAICARWLYQNRNRQVVERHQGRRHPCSGVANGTTHTHLLLAAKRVKTRPSAARWRRGICEPHQRVEAPCAGKAP